MSPTGPFHTPLPQGSTRKHQLRETHVLSWALTYNTLFKSKRATSGAYAGLWEEPPLNTQQSTPGNPPSTARPVQIGTGGNWPFYYPLNSGSTRKHQLREAHVLSWALTFNTLFKSRASSWRIFRTVWGTSAQYSIEHAG